MNDLPIKDIDDDRLDINNFVLSIIDIVNTVSTPFTISIHGEWGSGKTGILHILENNFSESGKYVVIMFNTWQFSQISNPNNIDIVLFKYIINKLNLSSDEDKKEKINYCISILDSLIQNKVIDDKYVSVLSDILKLSADIKYKNYSHDYQSIENMRNKFKEIIDEHIDDTGKLIVLIDDMDRIDQNTVLHLLSSIKIFFDIKKCIFILALDYDTFSKNIRDNFRYDYSHAEYLDKIIQLNISIPVNSYCIDKFVEEQFQFERKVKKWEESKKLNLLSEYVRLVENSVGRNPRAIKRLSYKYIFYSNYFLKNINQDKMFNYQSQALFALICLKESYHELYEEIAVRRKYDLSFIIEMINVLRSLLYNNDVKKECSAEIVDADLCLSIIQRNTKGDYKRNVSMYNFLISFVESICISIDNRKKFKIKERILFENLLNLISDKKVSSFDYKIDKPLKLDDFSNSYLEYLNRQCSFLSKINSGIYKNTYNNIQSICFNYSVGPFSFTFSIEKHKDGVHAFLIDRENIATSYRKYIYHWAAKELIGLPECRYDVDSKFVIFTPVIYLESMQNDYAGTDNDFFKETTYFMMKNFLSQLEIIHNKNYPIIKQIRLLYEKIKNKIKLIFSDKKWNIIFPEFNDMLLRFSRINIYKQEWNNKIYISFEAQDFFFQGMIVGIRRKMYEAKFKNDYDVILLKHIINNDEEKYKSSSHWVVYNYLEIKDFTKGLYTNDLVYQCSNSENKIIEDINKNLLFYKKYENDLDELSKMALF